MFAVTPSLRRALLGIVLLAPVTHADAADWTIDKAHSTLGFSGTQTGTKFQGHFTRYDGSIHFDPDHPETGHALITIDMASATTGDRQRDEALPGGDWFNTKTFPKATFEIKSFRPINGNNFEALGTLTLRGISHEATLPFALDITGDAAHAKGHLELVRTAFGVGQGTWASGQWVALEVGVDVDLIARQSP
ncbi:YceI family protein [Beijerinckia indica]|uniref:YceI family protein n=1 Tax=Beijerinckia indica subsp. indica (strain ATCC 9039 / DSM 1715 / NCIMB 8712) TaxID=395963 RepID=B2IEG1_BEII9|nr:YceI family protein [Beijerinckia indica]ACB95559.1 YceI family protein [Beijerinckia indica subsp. indica ATCC 9039]